MLLVNRANVTGVVDRMEKTGWVSRGSGASDRRVNQGCITAEGRRLLNRSEKAYLSRVEQVIYALGEKERMRLCISLARLRKELSSREG